MKNKYIHAIGAGVRKRAPALLLGAGIAGMVTTTVLAVRATPKAMRLLEEKKAEVKDDLTPIEVVKTAGPCYIPAAVTAGLGVACLIESHKIHGRRNAALATLYSLSESALREYQEKVIETVGPKKEESIRDEIDKDRVQKNPVSRNEVILTGNGETLCYEVLSGRYFKSDINCLKKAMNDLNYQMMNDYRISLNEYFMEIGLDGVDSAIGEELGWNLARGTINLRFSSQLTDEGTPCLVVSHQMPPTYEYKFI